MSTMPLLKNFRTNLAAACNLAEISQRELSRRSGVHYVTICRILSGSLDPSVAICERLARAAGMRADLAFLEPEKNLVDSR